jgi:ubiquinone/menaquinone biosynthesis C-methylase UbiE
MDPIYKKIEWWEEEYEFFGEFYHAGDNSLEGYDANNKLSRFQRTEREVGFIKKYLNPHIGDRILDCPCGSGRHAIYLNRLGFNVVGVDINRQMLAFHKELLNGEFENLPVFEQMDMRSLKFRDSSFDFAVNIFLSFGFFRTDSDNEKVVKEFYRVIKPGGKLLIHLDLNYDRVIQGRYFGEENITRECSIDGVNKTLEVIENYDPDTKRLYGTWKLLNGNERLKHYDLRIYDNNNEFVPLFKRNGFKDVTLIDPDNSFFDINSKETILIATK